MKATPTGMGKEVDDGRDAMTKWTCPQCGEICPFGPDGSADCGFELCPYHPEEPEMTNNVFENCCRIHYETLVNAEALWDDMDDDGKQVYRDAMSAGIQSLTEPDEDTLDQYRFALAAAQAHRKTTGDAVLAVLGVMREHAAEPPCA